MTMHSSGLSRRALLKGRLTSRPVSALDEPSIHISSAVVSVLPNRREDIIERLSAIEGVEIHHAESFKIVVVLEAGAVAGDFETVMEELRERYGVGTLPRTINMITGPSRSADIEQTLILGAHGPRKLHVILVGEP